MTSHPYISGPGSITQMIGSLRKTFPQTVNSDTVKKLGLAPKNESYVINALQFIAVIDQEGKRLENAHDVFVLGEGSFQSEFANLIRTAYRDLFELRGEEAWTLPKPDLINFFRTSDKTSDIIGGRQAGVFQAFSALSGYSRLCCANPMRDSSRESSVVAGWHEQTHTPLVQDQELARL